MNDIGADPAEALSYPFAKLPPAGSVVEVADGILWLSTPLPFAGLRQVNLWLLRDGDGWTMIDCGYGYDAARDAITVAWRAGLGGRPVKRLIITHFHPDHTGNSAWIGEAWGVEPLMTQAEWFCATIALRDRAEDTVAPRIKFYREHGLDATRLQSFRDGAVLYSAGTKLPPSFTRIRDGDAIAINGDIWTVIVGEGHSPEHAALYCAARKIIISGDQILPTITTNVSVWPTEPDADPLGLFLASGRKLGAMLDPETLVLPSHRLPFRNVHGRLRQLERHHDERLALVLKASGAETRASDLIDVMFERKLDGHQLSFAMGEAIAHLNHLVVIGKMEKRRDAGGTWRYRKRA